ncbi:hypothetical protein [Bacteriophage Phobos]|uniref:Uncharacterized protein n=1 Tax=Bacteriophage Phobos TaxID=2662138 RepID=A0A5Q2UAF2_9CAUD|nr:hypothetical protein JT319_gp55 [Bacteriophage Phobos]QGH45024.1 hypothetical protein [Bacteriophage Phobos]
MRANIGYHTRSDGNNTVKLTGGSFGGAVDQATIERLVRAHFTVRVKPSGRAVFVDREGRDVSLYLTVDPDSTEAGKAALRADRLRRETVERQEHERRRDVLDALDDMSTEELAELLALRQGAKS